MKNISYLSLGSNIGDRANNIKIAISNLYRENSINVLLESTIYETSPLYNENRNNFFNNVIKIETSLKPLFLLKTCKKIEKKIGRKYHFEANMPRIIDIDILTYNDEEINSDQLIIPHTKLYERKFVLIPMHEIAPKFIFPNKKSINDILNVIEDSSKIIKLDKLLS